MNWYLKALRDCFNFKGRARKKEFILFFLFNLCFACLAIIIDGQFQLLIPGLIIGYVFPIYCILILIPSIALIIRRFHDTGKNGWNILEILIPVIGPFLLVLHMMKPGQKFENEFGEDPRLEAFDDDSAYFKAQKKDDDKDYIVMDKS